eukprot:6461535-Amphidinium_carterae.1
MNKHNNVGSRSTPNKQTKNLPQQARETLRTSAAKHPRWSRGQACPAVYCCIAYDSCHGFAGDYSSADTLA